MGILDSILSSFQPGLLNMPGDAHSYVPDYVNGGVIPVSPFVDVDRSAKGDQQAFSSPSARIASAFGALAPAAPTQQTAEVSPAPTPVPLPKPRPTPVAAKPAAEKDDDEEDATPANAQPTSGQSSDVAAPSGSLLDRLGKTLSDNSNLLLGLGAGFAGAPSLGTGLSRGFAGASAGSQLDLKQQQQQQAILAQNQTARALVAKGEDPAVAIAAIGNPTLMKALIDKHFALTKYEFKTEKDALGQEHTVAFDPYTGKKVGGAESGEGDNGAQPGQLNLLAPGVKQIDSTKTGDEYVAQFGPEVQSAVKAWINGDVMPTGNPRQQGINTLAKTIATKWGQDTGNPVNDATYSAKRKMQTDIGSSSAGSMGGILSNGRSAFQHLANLGEKFTDLGNYSGPNIPGGGYIGEAGNFVGNTIAPSPKTLGKLTAVHDNALKYGQESTKFYAATGGGAHERADALNTVGNGRTNAESQASFLETEKQLMLERFAEKERQIASVMGEDWLAHHPVRDQALAENIAKIDRSIAQLRGAASAVPAAPAKSGVNRTATGVTWSIGP